jgi:pyruvate/2-oxoglutarate dehydrogenase complex dihydrolipoamide acyltransferase (E2) component
MGEGIRSAKVVALLKKPGDRIALDDALCEVETDKAVYPIESSFAGTMGEWKTKIDDTVEIGTRTWEADQQIEVDTFSGNIDVRVPDTAAGTVTFNSFSGHLKSEIPLTLRTTSRRSIKAELPSARPVTAEAVPGAPTPTSSRGSMRFKTFSGSVRIDR